MIMSHWHGRNVWQAGCGRKGDSGTGPLPPQGLKPSPFNQRYSPIDSHESLRQAGCDVGDGHSETLTDGLEAQRIKAMQQEDVSARITQVEDGIEQHDLFIFEIETPA